MLLGEFLHQPNRRAVGHLLGGSVPPRILFGTEVWTVKNLLQAADVGPALCGLSDEAHMLLDHRSFDGFEIG